MNPGGEAYRSLQPAGFPGLPAGWISEAGLEPAAEGHDPLFAVTHRDPARTEGGTPFRALLIVHGLGEHGGRYLHFPHHLGASVAWIKCLDLRGHGRSPGVRGHIPEFDLFARDVAAVARAFAATVRARDGEPHLLGHSMGGLITLRALLSQGELDLASVSISAPLLGIRAHVPAWKQGMGKLLSNVWGDLQLGSAVDPADLSRDPAVAQAYRADRLVHGVATPKFFTELLAAMADTRARREGISPPLQMLVPQSDRVVDAAKAEEFFRELKHPRKRIRFYPETFHEPFNDLNREEVFGDLAQWIEQNSQVRTSPASSSA